ncbi:hypothetical protein [Ralstonia soli]|uniref:Transposase n=1 Tax=Ralstonia soli TaxID=2953896 RepID=A0ABT1AHM3_9RALS|nr:hypothetical protein [Ralstonia soli]MCO5397881.1 hypothetical protein [Ralstonia soli]
MPKPETITMTMRELDRFKVIQAVADQGLAIWRAAERQRLINRLDLERALQQVAPCQPSNMPVTRTTALPITAKKNRTGHKTHARADI